MYSREFTTMQVDSEPISTGQAAFLGSVMGATAVFVGQAVEPVPALSSISSLPMEVGLISGSVLAGAILMSASNFVAQRISQWQEQRAAVSAEDVENIVQGFEALLADSADDPNRC